MRDRPPVGAWRVLPPVLMLCVLATLASLASSPLSNPDTFLHLRLGQEFLTGGWAASHPGHVSTFESADWAPTQWLSQVVMAGIDDRFGMAGLAWFSGLLFVGLAVTIYLVARREAGPLPATVVVALVVLASGPGLSLRPQVISFLLTAVTASVWRASTRTGRLPWLLLPTTWLWAMCHGMWPVAFLLGGTFLLGAALDRRLPPRRLLAMAGVVALSCLGPLVTPVGPRLVGAVAEVNARRSYFAEWRTPDFSSSEGWFVLVLLALTVVLMARGARPTWGDLLLLVVAAGLAAYSLRTVPVAAAAVAPLTAAALQGAMPARLHVPVPRDRALVAVAAVAVLAGLVVAVPRTADRPAVLSPAADSYLDGLPRGTVVLDDMTLGSYLIWRHPGLDVTAHGYADVYTTDELDAVARVARLDPGWVDDVRVTGAEVAVLGEGSAVAAELSTAYGWSTVFDDRSTVVLHAPGGWTVAS